MASGYEDQPVDSLDFGSLSDDELQKIADSDDRSTAQEKAQAELNRREAGDESAPERDPNAGISVTSMTSPDDPVARAEALGLNPEGINLDPDAGQVAVQEYFDAVEESGTIPPTGGPPSDAFTVAGSVAAAEQAKEAREAAQREAWEK